MITTQQSAYLLFEHLNKLLEVNKLSGHIAANHIHYKYTSQQIADLSPEARQRFEWAYKYDPNPEALITDADLDYIVEYDSLTDTISGGKHSVQLSALGVTLLDPENLDPLENTAFDTVAIMDNVEDGGTLSDLYVRVSSTEDEGLSNNWPIEFRDSPRCQRSQMSVFCLVVYLIRAL